MNPSLKHYFFALTFLLLALPAVAQEAAWKNIGRSATPAEIKAWDIDVRGDFKGLPAGKGSVVQGEQIWENKCASCHGVFGESNEVFPPIAGGITAADIQRGRVAALADGGVAQRTTIMKLAKLSTLWDYINRAMPWDAPKSLSTDEVYSVVAYVLNLGGVVGSDFELSDKNMAATQAKLPNRDGLKTFDGLWLTKAKPDVLNRACQHNCTTTVDVTSFLPDFARNAHGNLAEQNRLIGPVRGADTTRPAPKDLLKHELRHVLRHDAPVKPMPNPVVTVSQNNGDIKKLLAANNCAACHAQKTKSLGPALLSIAAKYKDNPERVSYWTKQIRKGSNGVWGSMAMPPQTQISEADLRRITEWLAAGAQ